MADKPLILKVKKALSALKFIEFFVNPKIAITRVRQ